MEQNDSPTDNEEVEEDDDEEDEVIQYFNTSQNQYSWDAPESQQQTDVNPRPMDPRPMASATTHKQRAMSSTTTHTPVSKVKLFTSYSATTSPSTQARLNNSSNNPFLTDDGESITESVEDMENVQYADLFQNYKVKNNDSNDNNNNYNTNHQDNNRSKHTNSNINLNMNQENSNTKRNNQNEYGSHGSNVFKSANHHENTKGHTNGYHGTNDTDKPSGRANSHDLAPNEGSPDNTDTPTGLSNSGKKIKRRAPNRPPRNHTPSSINKPLNDATCLSAKNESRYELARGGAANHYVSSPHPGPRVFGKNYKYMKGYINNVHVSPDENYDEFPKPKGDLKSNTKTEISKRSQSNSGQMIRSGYQLKNGTTLSNDIHDGSPTEEEHHKTYAKLQQELKSSTRKIGKLKEINDLSIQRKNELQREVLDGYKTISHLEISGNGYRTKQRELTVEIRIAKQRIGDAEREASHAIGRASKLERDLKDVETKRLRYFEELNEAERRLNTMESEIREIKSNWRVETENKNKLVHQLKSKEDDISAFKSRYENLEEVLVKKEKEHVLTLTQLEIVLKERAKHEGQVEKINKANTILKDDLQRLQTKYEISQRTVEQCTTRVKNQKDKLDCMMSSRLTIEKELREIHDELSRQRVEKHQYSNESKDLTEKLNENKSSLGKYKQECEILQRENRNLKDKVLYLDLYKQMIDAKSKEIDANMAHKHNNNIVTNHSDNLKSQEKISDSIIIQKKSDKYNSELLEITKKIDNLKQEHVSIHQKAQPSNKDIQSEDTSSVFYNRRENLISKNRLRNDKTNELFNFDAKTDVIVSNDILRHDDKDDSFYDVDEDSDQSPIELMMNLKENTAIFPSFVVGIQQGMNNRDQYETNFSDIVQAGNNDIANALL